MQPVQLASTARQHIKLDHLEEFHCIMPKDMTKPQDTPRTPMDPSTAPAASSNTADATSWPQDAASQQLNTASQAMHSASQAQGAASWSEGAASHQQSAVDVPSSSSTSASGQARLGSADSLHADAVSKPRDSSSTTSGSSSSSSSTSAGNNLPRSSNLQDTKSSNAGNPSTAKAVSISSVGVVDTQVTLGSNGDATSNLSKPVDGAVSKAGEAAAATASALQQAQQAAQGTRRSEQSIEKEDEEQALSGSVSKSGFEFCGSGDQFKVGCKAESQHRLICYQSQKSAVIALNMKPITACCMFARR